MSTGILRDDATPYDPWADVALRWPEVRVLVRPLAGRLLGELSYPVIVLRADSSAAQRRCTLAHELVHLERGTADCGPWSSREEDAVHAEAARRLISLRQLRHALREHGDDHFGTLAAALDVDADTLRSRLRLLTSRERAELMAQLRRSLWPVS
jgi:hypothetical protein